MPAVLPLPLSDHLSFCDSGVAITAGRSDGSLIKLDDELVLALSFFGRLFYALDKCRADILTIDIGTGNLNQ